MPLPPKTFTVFCQEASGHGTIWIDTVTLPEYNYEDVPIALIEEKAKEACREAWGYPPDGIDIHCMGIAEGDITIHMWDDSHME